MGKVRILSGGEGGRYTVDPVLDEAMYTALRQQAEDQEAFAATLVAELDAEIIENEAEQADAIQRVDNATNAYVQAHRDGEDISGPLAELSDAQANLAHISGQLSIKRAQRSLAESRRFEAQKTIDALDAEANPPPREAWCADFTEDAEGEIASIEVPGEPQEPIIIYPQDLNQGHHQRERDGLLTPRAWQTGPQVYYNAAVLPGWQRHRPTYRIGEILSVDSETDTADVRLDPAQSSAQGLPINTQPQLSGIPVEYMDCNSVAFEEGDRVVVQFHQTEEPKVIGFEKEPKRCGLPVFAVVNFVTGYNEGQQQLVELSPDYQEVRRRFVWPGRGTDTIAYSGGWPVDSCAFAGPSKNPAYAVQDGESIRFSSGASSSGQYYSVSSDGGRFIALRYDPNASEPQDFYDFFDLEGNLLSTCRVSPPSIPDGTAAVNSYQTDASSDRLFSVWVTNDGNNVPVPWEFNQSCAPIDHAFVDFSPTNYFGVTDTRRASLRRGSSGHFVDLFTKHFSYHGSQSVPGYNSEGGDGVLRDPVFRRSDLTIFGHHFAPGFPTWQQVFNRADAIIHPTDGDSGLDLGPSETINLTALHGFHQVTAATINKTTMRDLGGL